MLEKVRKRLESLFLKFKSLPGKVTLILKGAICLILATLIVKGSIALALSLMIVPFTKLFKNEYTKVIVGFMMTIVCFMLLSNGVVIFADVAIVILSYSIWEMLTTWYSYILRREAKAT